MGGRRVASENEMPGHVAPDEQSAAVTIDVDDVQARYLSMLSVLDDAEILRQEAVAEKAKLQVVVQGLSDGIVLLSLDGKVAVVNDRAIDILGFPAGYSLSRPGLSSVSWLGLSSILKKLESGEVVDEPLTVSRAPLCVVRLQARRVEREGQHYGTLLLLSDVTRERELDLAKAELITNVSHELRTPLSAVKIVLSNLSAGVFGEVGELLAHTLETADRNVERLALLIDELLEAARTSERGIELSLDRVDLPRLCDDLHVTYAPLMEQHKLSFEHVLGDISAPLVADAKRLFRVISNLLNNSLKFTPAGGRVRVEIRREGDAYLFAVSDTGRGIDPRDHARIFDRFHQVGRSYGPGAHGIGLGLSIGREIVEAHGGRIWIESSLGKGATFFFTIPLRDR